MKLLIMYCGRLWKRGTSFKSICSAYEIPRVLLRST